MAYIATNFVSQDTATYFQYLLHNTTEHYLAGVATWADTIRYTKWGKFTEQFHFIDAKDDPPNSCDVDLERDCKTAGCVVTALHNYTTRVLDARLPYIERNQAAKFVIHFVGDIHQPLHDEDVARGGNGIHVLFDDVQLNLHHVWDSSIAEKIAGGIHRKPYDAALKWATDLTHEIKEGKFKNASKEWTDGMDLDDPASTALRWARQGNAYVCSHGESPPKAAFSVLVLLLTSGTVLPEGPKAIVGQELGSEYYEKAAPVIEVQVARAGYRLAAWLDRIAAASKSMGDL